MVPSDPKKGEKFKNVFLIFRASRELSTAWNFCLLFEVLGHYGNNLGTVFGGHLQVFGCMTSDPVVVEQG